MSGERRGAHPAGRGSTRVHAGGAVQLPVAGLLQPAQRGGADQQPLAGGSGFERPGIRGLAKMRLRVTMAITGDGLGAHPGRLATPRGRTVRTRYVTVHSGHELAMSSSSLDGYWITADAAPSLIPNIHRKSHPPPRALPPFTAASFVWIFGCGNSFISCGFLSEATGERQCTECTDLRLVNQAPPVRRPAALSLSATLPHERPRGDRTGR